MIPDSLSAVANHLWQSTLVAGVGGLLTLVLRKNAARVRHGVWVAASLKFFVPFALLTSLGHHIHWNAAAPPMSGDFSQAVDQFSHPFNVFVVSSPSSVITPRAGSLPALLALVWVIGFVGCAGSWWVRWRRIAAGVRTGSRVKPDLPIRAISSCSFREPGVLGVFRPILLLPDGIFEHLTPEQWKCVLEHELCHIRRRDNLIAMLQMCVETVFWFYPLVWWIGRRILQERELACDEEVLRLGSEPGIYAQSILRVCELYLESPPEWVAGVTGSDLKRRIHAITTQRGRETMTATKRLLVAVAGVAAVTGPIMVGILNAPQIRAQSAPASTPKFEVASIRPCQEADRAPMDGENSSPGRLRTGCLPLLDPNGFGLIRDAYALFPDGRFHGEFTPIDGGPPWLRSAFYEISATAEGAPNLGMMMGPMMQALLEDRFQLKIHRQKREDSVYFLTAARGGPKLHSTPEGGCMPRSVAPSALQPGQEYCKSFLIAGSRAVMEFPGTTLDDFSNSLPMLLDRRPVINKTGIAGRFDIHIEFAGEGTRLGAMALVQSFDGASNSEGLPSIFTAVEEQLGLKLEPAKGLIEHLIIDHIERPSAN